MPAAAHGIAEQPPGARLPRVPGGGVVSPAVSAHLESVVAATAQWLTRAYPASGGAFSAALAQVQARQAAAVAARLRYPTAMDAALLALTGPNGSGRLDWVTGADAAEQPEHDYGWRTWVDEVVASWAACLLTDPGLAAAAVALAEAEGSADGPRDFRRLTDPGEHDRRAAALLRHPDLLAPVADLHRESLLERLGPHLADAA